MSIRKLKKVIGCKPTRFKPFEDSNTLFCEQCKFKTDPIGCEMFRRKLEYRRVSEKIN